MRSRSSIGMPRNGAVFRHEEDLGQNSPSVIGNLCFRLFVVGMLIFIIIAAAYKNPDPFFRRSSSKIIKFLTSNSDDAIFASDVGTGDDSIASSVSINLTDIDSEMQAAIGEASSVSNNRDCGVDDPIDCRDPDVFNLLMRATIDKFKDTHFYRFGKPVRGENDSCCHMAWRFRPKHGNDAALNKDYRSFVVVRYDNCSIGVDSMGEYHSGSNARKRKVHEKGRVKNKAEESSVSLTGTGETVDDDALPVLESEDSFTNRKYLIYSGGGDRCKTMAQYLWSLLCMLGEAQYLNRTLVMDISICLSKIYSSSGVDEEGKDFRFYFDFEHLKHSASVVDQHEFWSGWAKWQQRDGLSLHLVEDFRVTPLKLAEVSDTLIMRKFGSVEPDNYWYRVCDGETASVIQRPWHMIWKSKLLMDIASAIAARMNSDYDAVYVNRRSSDRDAQPEAPLLSTLTEKIVAGRNLYVAANEQDRSFFDPLKEKYSTHFLDEYRDLWDAKSDWDAEMKKLNNGITVEFDGYMRASVDREVFMKGKKQIETFKDHLTQKTSSMIVI